jgi:hypothetical protein
VRSASTPRPATSRSSPAELKRHEEALAARKAELEDVAEERRLILERTAGMTAEQSKAELVASIEGQAKREAAVLVRDLEHGAREEGDSRARKIVTLAIQRVASEQTAESVVSVLHLPSDDMKGRIIGREGRNIRAFESVTGVNLIIDDTPEASCSRASIRCAARPRGSRWRLSSSTGVSTRTASRRSTSGARPRSRPSASGPARTPSSGSASPTCIRT